VVEAIERVMDIVHLRVVIGDADAIPNNPKPDSQFFDHSHIVEPRRAR
jgi:hypothetical protein